MQQFQSTQNKEEFRRFCKLKRQNLFKSGVLDTISKKAIEKIKDCKEFQNAHHIMTYYPLLSEINLNKLLDEDKNFYLPRCNKNNIEVCPYKLGDKLVKSDFGVLEPISNAIDPKILDLVITPCIAADENGYRIGYGKGFYDKFFKKNDIMATKIVVVPKELYFKQGPRNENDIKCNFVIYL